MKRFGKKEFVGYWESNINTVVYQVCDIESSATEITLCSIS
jgi:hypothetical protein